MRLPRLVPPDGPRYELFDTSFYLTWTALVAYVIFPLPPSTRAATGAPLLIVSEQQLGWLVGGSAIVGIVLAYSERWYRVGYIVARTGAFFMTLNFAASLALLALGAVNLIARDPDPMTAARSGLLFVMFYAWPTRRLKRDNRVHG